MTTAEPPGDNAASLTTEGHIDTDFLTHVGTRIRELRMAKSLTVQELADRAQISRRLLTQIEHGQANPSLVAVTRIARQLGTETTTLLSEESAETDPIMVFDGDQQTLVWSSELGSTAHLLVSTSETRAADLWLWRLRPSDSYRGRPDPARSQELFYVLDGCLTLHADQLAISIPAGSSSRLRSDRDYAYANDGTETAVFVRTVALTT